MSNKYRVVIITTQSEDGVVKMVPRFFFPTESGHERARAYVNVVLGTSHYNGDRRVGLNVRDMTVDEVERFVGTVAASAAA